LQGAFLAALGGTGAPLSAADLVVPLDDARRGSFLTFRRSDITDLHARLTEAGIVTDVRGDRLRIGFGLYHAAEDAPRAAERVAAALAA
jgi:kynureninase